MKTRDEHAPQAIYGQLGQVSWRHPFRRSRACLLNRMATQAASVLFMSSLLRLALEAFENRRRNPQRCEFCFGDPTRQDKGCERERKRQHSLPISCPISACLFACFIEPRLETGTDTHTWLARDYHFKFLVVSLLAFAQDRYPSSEKERERGKISPKPTYNYNFAQRCKCDASLRPEYNVFRHTSRRNKSRVM